MLVIEERQVCRMLEGLFHFDKECEWNDAIEEAMHRFVNLPTIEAEPVVRCKDCIWYRQIYSTAVCERLAGEPTISKDFYCAGGERRNDEAD